MLLIKKIAGPVAEWVDPTLNGFEEPHRIFPTPNAPFNPGRAQQCPWPQDRRRRAGCVWRPASLEMRSIGWAKPRELQPPSLTAPAPPLIRGAHRLCFLVWREKEAKPVLWANLIASGDALSLETRPPKYSRRPITGMGTIRLQQLGLSPILYFFISQSKWLPKAICDL